VRARAHTLILLPYIRAYRQREWVGEACARSGRLHTARIVNGDVCAFARVYIYSRGGASIARSTAMNDDRSEDDPIMDLWYSSWEQQCVEAIESEPDCESQLHNAKELYSQQMWMSFQTTASAIAQLYKGICLCFCDVTASRIFARYRLSFILSFPPSFRLFENVRDSPLRSSDHDRAMSLGNVVWVPFRVTSILSRCYKERIAQPCLSRRSRLIFNRSLDPRSFRLVQSRLTFPFFFSRSHIRYLLMGAFPNGRWHSHVVV